MKTTKKHGMVYTIVMAVLLMGMTAYDAGARGKMKGQEGAMKGQIEMSGNLLSVNSDSKTITVETEVLGLTGPEKKSQDFQVADNAKWHICVAGECSDKVGADGFREVSEHVGKEAKTARVTLYREGNIVTALNVDIPAAESKTPEMKTPEMKTPESKTPGMY